MAAGRPRALIAAAGTVMVLAAVPTLDSQGSSAYPSNAQSGTLLGHTRIDRIYPPEAGLRLIEDILMRIRSSPQLAMAKQNMRMQSDELAQANRGPTDYRLAIKPREVGKAAAAPAVEEDSLSEAGQAFGGGGQAGGKLGIWESSDAVHSKVASLPETISPSAKPDGKGLWEKDSKQPGLSEESQRRLSQSLGGLFNVANKMAQAQRMAALPAPSAPAAARSGGYGGNAKMAMSLSDERSVGGRGTLAKTESSNPIGTATSVKKAARQTRARRYDLALLPPNVVTGLPMMRLGCSETEACGALSALGTPHKININGWTIWSYDRGSVPVLQVYVKHRQVEALRVFDSSLLSLDFGVRLGDDLSVVKERFGEPAFMLSEPLPGVGQNYVYPLSQIGFLFTRPSNAAPPVVAGLLIFNVKW